MLISNFSIQNIYKTNKISGISNPNFGGFNSLDTDKFDKTCDIKNVKLKNSQGKLTNALIIAEKLKNTELDRNPKMFTIKADDKQLGYMVVQDEKKFNSDKLYLASLYTKINDVNYKGAGTELIKCAIEESMNRGYNGQIILFASNLYNSPVPFYYKNNFIATSNRNSSNAAIHYALKNNSNINIDSDTDLSMMLTSDGAKAFLDGTRLYEKRTFEKIADKTFKNSPYSINYIQSPNKNEFFILAAKEDEKRDKVVLIMTCREHENMFGKKDVSVANLDKRVMFKDSIRDFALESLEEIAKQKKYENIEINASFFM